MNDLKQIEKTIKKLREDLNNWNYKYYVLNQIDVDDVIYDNNLQKLVELEKKYPQFVTNDSPTKNVGIEIANSNFSKAEHIIKPMLSLRNAFTNDDILHFNQQIKELNINDYSYFVEPKIDGLSISLSYNKGLLVRALTRGDGFTGEIVTKNIYQINTIPKKIELQDKIEIRGEIYMPINDFNLLNRQRILENEKLIQEGKKPLPLFANPRNAASGTLRQLDYKIVQQRNLNGFFFELLYDNSENIKIRTQKEILKKLKEIGFNINQYSKEVKSIKNLAEEIEKLSVLRKELDYEIDGIVIKINQRFLYEKIGETSKFPKWAIAYKFPAELKETQILEIFPTVGRTGRITYNAKLLPINLLGTTVQRATLHNANYVKSLKINVGDYVLVKKAGDIIPKVISLSPDHKKINRKKWIEAKICPSCQQKLVTFEGEIDQYCININCPDKILESLIHYTSREAMRIEGLSEKNIEKLYNLGFIKNILDIYKLKEKKEQLLKIEGYKEKSINNLLNSIELSKRRNLDNFLFALGIRYIGKKSASDLAKKYLDMDLIMKLKYDDLLGYKTFGDVKSQSLIKFFKNPENLKLINELREIGINFKNKSKIIDTQSKFLNKRVLVTGTISGGSRIEIKEKLKDLGAEVLEHFSKTLDYLLVGDKPSLDKITKIEKEKIIYIKSISDIK